MIALILLVWAIGAVAMAGLWWRQQRTKNATSVDVAWSFMIGAFTILFAVLSDGAAATRIVVGILAGGWAFRLGTHLLVDRVMRHTAEDGRYAALREHWGTQAGSRFFMFYQAQALVAVLFSVPVLAAMEHGPLDLRFAGVGIAVWVIAVLGETIADRQLARFRGNPASEGTVCRDGLWKYSRHPNYFFEWVHWWTYVIISQGALLTWIGPAVMIAFLYRVSGIPYTEMQAIRSRGDRYRAYQQSTSAFFPWFPRKEAG